MLKFEFGNINNLSLIGDLNPNWKCHVCGSFLNNSKYSQFYCSACDTFYHYKLCDRVNNQDVD